MGSGAKRAILAALAALAIQASAAIARADDPAIAEKLFLEGKRLTEEGKYAAACEKFKAAHDLDVTATGTLLNLALCHEQVGRNATAWAEFRQVIAESTGRRADRVTLAQQHEAKLAPLLSFLVIKVPAKHVSGLRVEIDKKGTVAEATWGVELPTDAGPHSVAVSAPGRVSRTIEVVVGEAGDRRTVEIPELAEEPAPPPSTTRAAEPSPRRTVGFALGGVGAAAIATGAVFGLLAMSKSSDADDASNACPGKVCPNDAARGRATDTIDDAKLFANVSNIAIGVGIVALAAGVVLVLTSKPSAKTASSLLRPTANGFSLGGTW